MQYTKQRVCVSVSKVSNFHFKLVGIMIDTIVSHRRVFLFSFVNVGHGARCVRVAGMVA